MSRSSIITLAIILIVLIIAAWFTFYHSDFNQKKVLEKSDANTALSPKNSTESFTDLTGQTISLEQYLGTPIVAHSWASWCPQCADQLALFSDIQSSLKREVVFLAVNRSENQLTAQRYLNVNSISDNINLVLDPSDNFYSSIGGYAMPETVVYDQNGEVAAHYRGEVKREKLIELLDSL